MIRFIIGFMLVLGLQIPDDAPMSAFLVYVPVLALMFWGIHGMKKKGIL